MTSEVFDEDGLPAGSGGDELIATIAADVCRTLNADGWDQPPQVLWLLPAAATLQRAPELDAAALDGDEVGTPYGVIADQSRRLRHYTDLVGMTAPADAAAAILVTEAWRAQLPAGAVLDTYGRIVGGSARASEAPDRVEVRNVSVVTRSGRVWNYTHTRGDVDPIVTNVGGDVMGRAVSYLARTVGIDLPGDPPVVPVAETFGAAVLSAVTHSAQEAPNQNLIPVTVLMMAMLCDGLTTTLPARWEPAAPQPGSDLGVHGPLARAVIAAGGDGDLRLQVAEEVMTAASEWSHATWPQVFTAPGGKRWTGLAHAHRGAAARWMGLTLLAHEVTGVLPSWSDSMTALIDASTVETGDVILEVLTAAGWIPATQ